MMCSYFHFCMLVSLWVFVYSQNLEFIQQPNAVYYTYTSVPLVIRCNSTGTQITYRRNNAPVGTTTSNEAHTQNTPIENVDGSAAGVYWDCQTSNDDGVIVSSRAIVYWAKYEDSSPSGDRTVTLRNTVNTYLPCDFFDGSLPPPVIGWNKNGVPITDPIILPGSNSLLLIAFEPADADTYQCFLENTYGDLTDRQAANRRYILNVVSENTFTLPPLVYPSTDFTNSVGEIIHFECVGYAASCDWQHRVDGNWVALPAGSSSLANVQSVTITADTPTEYRAIVGGDIETTRTLTIYQVPGVVSSIEGEFIEYERQTISIYCQRSGVPDPTVDLYKDRVLVQNIADKYTLTIVGNTTTLEIQNLASTDTGYYTCRADNTEASAVASGRITVRVAVPPSFSQDPTPISITQSSTGNFSISCTTIGDPLPQISWYFTSPTEALTLTNSIKYTVIDSSDVTNSSRTSTLTVSSYDARDNGDYKCVGENFKGITDSQVSTVLIPSLPMIGNTFPSGIVEIFQDLKYSQDCEAFGEPVPVVRWSSSLTDITANSSKYTIFPNNTLEITAKEVTAGSVYTCTATSGVDSVVMSFTLVVQGCAFVQVEPTGPLNSLEHVNASLKCTATGIPSPTSEWIYRRKGSLETAPFPGITNNVYQASDDVIDIIPITEENEGSYCCQVFTDGLNETCEVTLVCVDVEYRLNCNGLYFCIFELWQLIVIVIGALVLVLLILFGIVCLVYLIFHQYQSRTYNINRAVGFSLPYTKEKRDEDSDDDGEFDPTYESLPANKPIGPPVYKQAPYYNGGGGDGGLPSYNPPPQANADTTSLPMEGLHGPPPLAYPPPIDMHHTSMPMIQGNFTVAPEMYAHDYMPTEMYPGEMMQPQPEEFLSTEGQFV